MDINNIWSGVDLSKEKQNTRCLSINTILAGKYLVGPVLGQGGFGITYMGFDLNMETKIAIKEYFPVELVSRDTTTIHGDHVLSLSGDKSATYQAGLKKYVAEAQNVSQFSEIPGVVSVKDFFYENETAYIVMEYIDGISLKDYLKEKGGRLTEEETLQIMKPVLEALVKVHGAGMIHRDISPDNIMLTFKRSKAGEARGAIKDVKLIDFGAARMTEKNDQKSLTIILKHGYAPEEQYRTHGEQGSWTDVYAVCAVLYRMLTGETPVPAMDRLFQDDLKTPEEHGVRVGKNTSAAIMKGLAVKKNDRIQDMKALIAALYEGKAIAAGKSGRSGSGSEKGKKFNGRTGIIAAAAAVVVIGGIGLAMFDGKSGTTPDNSSADQNGNHVETEIAETQLAEADGETLVSVGEADSTSNTQQDTVTLSGMGESEEEFGEVIVTATPQTSFDGTNTYALIIRDDGTVEFVGENSSGQGNVEDWTRIADVAVGSQFSAGLRENGTVLVAGNLWNKEDVENWRNVIEIEAESNTLFGLTTDGIVLCSNLSSDHEELARWENIKTIAASFRTVAALTEDGRVLIVGGPEELTLQEISGWNDVQFMENTFEYIYGVREDGTLCFGSPWKELDMEQPDWVDEWKDIVQLNAYYEPFGVDKNGKVYSPYSSDAYEIAEQWGSLYGAVEYQGRVVGKQMDGTIQYQIVNAGNTDLEEFGNLESVAILCDSSGSGSYLTGITKDHQWMMTYGLDWNISEIGAAWNRQGVNSGIVDFEGYFAADYFEGEIGVGYESSFLTEDGVLYSYDHREADPEKPYYIEAQNIKEIDEISGYLDNYLFALTNDNKIKVFVKTYVDDYEPNPEIMQAEQWENIVQIVCCNSNGQGIVGLKADGTIELAQINPWSEIDKSVFSGIRSLHGGHFGVAGITEDGTAAILVEGDTDNRGQYNIQGWTNLKQLALGEYHTVGLKEDGTVYATGANNAGQCNVDDWTDIVFIEAGAACTIGIKSDGTMVVAGRVV